MTLNRQGNEYAEKEARRADQARDDRTAGAAAPPHQALRHVAPHDHAGSHPRGAGTRALAGRGDPSASGWHERLDVLRVLSDRVASFEASVLARLDQAERSLHERLTHLEALLPPKP